MELIKDFIKEVFPVIAIVLLLLLFCILIALPLCSMVGKYTDVPKREVQINEQQFERLVTAMEKLAESEGQK